MKKKFGITIAVIGLFMAAGYGWYRYTFPYGSKHCCLKCLGLALMNYAQLNHGRYPAGAGCPEASLSLLHRGDGGIDAYILSGKTIPVEIAASVLERGQLLGPDSCDWHYVEGLTLSDDSRLAIVWDKIGLGHNNQRLPQGGHSVMFLDCHEEVVPEADWPQFLEFQASLMAKRIEKAKTAKEQMPSLLEPKLRATFSRIYVSSLAFSPDGKTLAAGCLDSTVKLWDVATGNSTVTLRGHKDQVWPVAFSPNGKTLASGSVDGAIELWDMASGRNTATLIVDPPVASVVFSPDGKTLASGSGYSVRLWDVATGKTAATFSGHTDGVWSVAYSPDGKTLASGNEDETIRLWDVATGQNTATFRAYPHSAVHSVLFNPDGKTLASGSDNTIRLWDLATAKVIAFFDGRSLRMSSIAFSANGRILASGCSDYTVKLWDVTTGKIIATLVGHTENVSAVAFSRDSKTLASGSDDNTIKLWDLRTVRRAGK